jgi:glycerate kinase
LARLQGLQVLAAPDKFRGTATADEVCAAVAEAVTAAGGSCVSRPLADGGEGMLEAFGGGNRSTQVTGPAGTPVDAQWRLGGDGLAVVECARACGLLLAGGAEANDPVAATTRGVGELIVAAVASGANRILLGVGGSATTDGGLGAVDVLAEAFQDGLPVPVSVCCDVRTHFLDAARVYGPQKGATAEQIELLTGRLERLTSDYRQRFGVDVATISGSGAAGGLAGGLAALGARLVPGLDQVADEVGLAELIAAADLVVTGEGRFDATSLAGKVVGGVIERCAATGTPVLVLAGATDAIHSPQLRPDVSVISLAERFGAQRSWEATVACIRDAVADYLDGSAWPEPPDGNAAR